MRAVPPLSAALCAALGLGGAGVDPARADTPVIVEGADEAAREAILDLLPDRERPASLFEAERIAEEAGARALAWLRAEGYYAAEVTPEARDQPPSARLAIRPGARFVFSAPELVFAGEAPSQSAAAAATQAIARIEAGAPARAAVVLDAEAVALAALRDSGHADAAAGERRVIVDHAAGHVSVRFQFAAGQAVRLGELRAEPAGVFRSGFIAGLRNWRLGQSYTPERLARLRRDLAATGAVARATTRIEPADAAGLHAIVLAFEPAKRHAYELGLGYSTTEGFGGEAQWTRRNFSGRADALAVSATLGELAQGLNAELARPHAGRLGHTRRFSASATREDTIAFTRQGLALSASVDAARRLRAGLGYGVRLSADWFDNANGAVASAAVLSGFVNMRHDTTEIPLDPRDGGIVEFRIEPSISTGDATLGFVRATTDGRVFESFGRNDELTLAARVRAGWIGAIAGSVEDIPPDRRFYAGGGGSVRGYEYNSIYPRERDSLGLVPGGQGLLETSLEARWRFAGRLGGAAFVDGGAAFDDWRAAGDMQWGAGLGARYDLGFAPLRIDIAFPLGRNQGGPDYALYISLGQAF